MWSAIPRGGGRCSKVWTAGGNGVVVCMMSNSATATLTRRCAKLGRGHGRACALGPPRKRGRALILNFSLPIPMHAPQWLGPQSNKRVFRSARAGRGSLLYPGCQRVSAGSTQKKKCWRASASATYIRWELVSWWWNNLLVWPRP